MVLDILSIFNYLAFSIYLRLISVYYMSVKKTYFLPSFDPFVGKLVGFTFDHFYF